jgi:hypothetical protein
VPAHPPSEHAYGQPSLTRKKLRRLEITAGARATRGPRRLGRQRHDAPSRARSRAAGRTRLPTHRPRLARHGGAENGRERHRGAHQKRPSEGTAARQTSARIRVPRPAVLSMRKQESRVRRGLSRKSGAVRAV